MTHPHPPRATWLAWIGFWLAIALFFASRSIQRSTLSPTDLQSWLLAVAWNVPGYLLWGLFSFGIGVLRRLWPLDGRRRRHLYLHAAASVAVATLHLVVLGSSLGAVNRVLGSAYFENDLELTLPVMFHLNLLIYWLLALGGEALAYGRRVREQQVAEARLEQQLADARLAALRMQLHPHFLFNTLNSIAELVHVDLEAAERMTLRLSGLLRTALQSAGDHLVPLREEIEFLERYLEVEKVRFQDRLSIAIELDPQIAGVPVPSLVLQPLVENAVRHGIGRLPAGGHIRVRARSAGTHLVLEVENDAPGPQAPAARHYAGAGVGLANTGARLQQIFGARASFEFGYVPGDQSYRVRVALPFGSLADGSERRNAPVRGLDALRLADEAAGARP